MIGGLQRTVSRLAIVAAAGAMSSTAAMAADLGGNCCADLEERVAELEATTVRKGNRQVSLTISGNISQHVIYWDDGHESNTYVGSDDNRVTRFRFNGAATINSDMSAGFRMEFGLRGGSNTSQTADPAVDVLWIRQSYVFIKSKQYGTISVGHQSDSTDGIRSICLGCTADVSASSTTMVSNLQFKVNNTYGANWGALGTGNVADGGRRNLIKYVSPTIAGFQASGAWGDDDFYDVALRYVNEFGTIRVAAGIGYANAVGNGGNDTEYVSGSISLAHVPSGVYIAFAASETENGTDSAFNAGVGAPVRDVKDQQWFLGAGIVTKLNSLGKSTFSVGYGQSDEGFVGAPTPATLGLPVSGVTWSNADTEHWAIGFQQDIDAAAMQLFISYGQLSGDITNQATGASSSIDDTQYVNMGMNIKF